MRTKGCSFIGMLSIMFLDGNSIEATDYAFFAASNFVKVFMACAFLDHIAEHEEPSDHFCVRLLSHRIDMHRASRKMIEIQELESPNLDKSCTVDLDRRN